MKKINYLMFVSLLTAFAFGVMSCNKDKDEDVDLSKAIIGIWDVTSSETYIDGKTEEEFFKDYYKEHYTEYEDLVEALSEVEDLNGDGVIDSKDIDVDAAIDAMIDGGSSKSLEKYIEFKADGTAITYEKYMGEYTIREDTYEFKYSISGNKLTMMYEDEDGKEDPEDTEEAEISIKGKTLTITSKDEEYDTELDGKKHSRRNVATLTKR